MAQDHDSHEDGVSRRHALERMMWAGTGVLWAVSGGVSKRFSPLGRAQAESALAPTELTIPVIVKDTTSFYWQTVIAGARKAGQDLGVKIVELGAHSESDVSGQISILESAIASNPAAIVIAPVKFAALGRPIEEAARKFKIIGIDSAADTAAFTATLATDNVQAGRIAADILAERIQTTAHDIMAEIITAHSELRGVFALNLSMAQGAAEALSASKTNKTGDTINLVGFDWDDRLVKFLQDGTIAALVVQDPFRMGYDGVKTALAASKGEQVAAHIDTGVSVITKANMSSARSQALLHPKIN
jgi:ribose transport system substrate-binding protein